MEGNYSLSDIAAVSNADGFGGNNIVTLLLLFALVNGGLGWNNRGDFGQYATAASQQEILFGQKFSDIDNKMDRGFTSIGNGISSATFSLNNSIKDGNAMVAGRVIDEGRALQSQVADCCCKTQSNIDSVRFDMANYHADTNAVVTAQTQKILDAMAQNKIESLQAEVNSLKTQNMFCGIPRINPYGYGVYQYSNGCGCNCGNI